MNTRGFFGRQRPNKQTQERLPPGQHITEGFPVLSAGPSPIISLKDWDFTIENGDGLSSKWNWEDFKQLPNENLTADIHCVTTWSKYDNDWVGLTDDCDDNDGDHIIGNDHDDNHADHGNNDDRNDQTCNDEFTC